MSGISIVYLPSPPKLNVFRDWAGGYGTALESAREYPGHDQQFFDVPCLQLLYISQALRDKNRSIHYINLQRNERFVLNDFIGELREKKTKVLLTSLSLPSIEHDLSLLKLIKEQTNIKVVLTGMIAKLFKERVLKERYADYIIKEQEELVTPYVVDRLLEGDDNPKGAFYLLNNSIAGDSSDLIMGDLDHVEFPAYDLLDFEQYESTHPFDKLMRYATLLTSKGCPYPCSYCPYPIGFGKNMIYRSPQLVIEDIKRLVKQYQVELLVFRDQLFTLNKKHCEAVCRGIIENNIKVTWICETRYDLVDKKLLKLMHDAGCRKINYGLESGDEEIFLTMGKANAKQGLDYFGQIIRETKEAGIVSHTHLMLGLPNDSWKSIRNTVRFLKKYKPDKIQVAIFIPYPGTPLGKQLEAEGKIDNNNYIDYTGFKAVIPTKYMSIEEIEEARYYIYNVWDKTLWMRVKNKLRYWMGKNENH